MASRERKEGESFKDYRKALELQAYKDRQFLKGSTFWDSSAKGTYRRDYHG